MPYKVKEAAVFFVDLLGTGALTRNELDLAPLTPSSDAYYGEFLISSSINQSIAARNLFKFREILSKQKNLFNELSIYQFSDCAFIWSEKIPDVLSSVSNIMWDTTLAGLLCRGGLTYGEVIEPSDFNSDLGHYVLGDAITKAAKLEETGKGVRVFTDPESIYMFHQNFADQRTIFSTKLSNDMFSEILNRLDFSITDEYKWYLIQDLKTVVTDRTYEKGEMAFKVGALISSLKHSPFFHWNALSPAGRVHLAASIEFISSSLKYHTDSDESEIVFSANAIIQHLSSSRGVENMFGFLKEYGIRLFPKELENRILKAQMKKALGDTFERVGFDTTLI